MAKLGATLFIAYVIAGIFTFGHSASHCNASCHDGMERSMAGLMSAMFWPLYWSWWVQS